MTTTLLWILGSTVVVSLISLVGVFTLALREKTLNKILLVLVGFSAGALMGGAFLHLLPEAIEKVKMEAAGLSVLVGFSLFFIIERVLHWHHCHKKGCDVHTLSYMNLLGDSIHNFIDGVVIAISFLVSAHLGIVTTLAVIAHEIPQEIGDFGVLVYGGFSKAKALIFNFLTALTAVIGALAGYFLSDVISGLIPFVLPFAAGGFIYIGASDLVPELHKEPSLKKSLASFALFVVGVGFMLVIKIMGH
jgi:zinc and cadmium transporter